MWSRSRKREEATLSPQTTRWTSSRTVISRARPGVVLTLARMSFGRRLELMRRVRDLASRAEYFEAGMSEQNRMEAGLLAGEIDRLYVEWGVEEVRGLTIDGEAATVATLIERGPEDVFQEALEAVKAECGLSDEERKN